VIVICFSYFSQRHFSFRVANKMGQGKTTLPKDQVPVQ
jgi:hypothetical protein